jgi:hypothetical protein
MIAPQATMPSRLSQMLLAASLLALLSACSTAPPKPPSVDAGVARPAPPSDARPAPADKPAPKVLPPSASTLPPPKPVNNLDALRRQAAERLVAANPKQTYMGQVPDILLAIPVLEIELHSDGSVRQIQVLRHPRQARDTTQLAMDAVYRAAPFGDVSRMPRPWKFTETFLFNDDRRFKPRSLD